MSGIDQSTKLFNTAVIATRISRSKQVPEEGTCSARLGALIKTPAFHAILKSIKEYAQEAGLSEASAAEEIIRTFRNIDEVWDEYIFQEGLGRLKNQLAPKSNN